eukprot:6211325-Pleurochrysis_carterae.AAC.2
MGGSRVLVRASCAGTHTTGGGVLGGWQTQKGEIQNASGRRRASKKGRQCVVRQDGVKQRMLPAVTAARRLAKSSAIGGATVAVQTRRELRVGIARCRRPESFSSGVGAMAGSTAAAARDGDAGAGGTAEATRHGGVGGCGDEDRAGGGIGG